jgi:hypothetical protein
MTGEETFAALAALQGGDVGPMAALLRSGPVHPMVATTLAEMLEGSHTRAALIVTGPPKVMGRPRGRSADVRRSDAAIAKYVAQLRAANKASAIKLAGKHFGLPDHKVKRALAREAEAMGQLRRFLSAHLIDECLRGRLVRAAGTIKSARLSCANFAFQSGQDW